MPEQHHHLKEKLLQTLAFRLAAKGFRRGIGSRSQDFFKDVATGRYFVHLTFIDHSNDFDTVVNVSVRHNALLKLARSITPMLSEPEGVHLAFVGAELGNIYEGRQKRWTVVDEADIQEACSGIVQAFESVGEPYLEHFSSLDEILAATAGDDNTAFLHSPFHGTRAKTAVAAALILGKQELFRHLVDQKTQFLKERDDFELPSFIAFAEVLASVSHMVSPDGSIGR
jgi:hypothetical protein